MASVGVSLSEIDWNGHIGRFTQLSTVMTEPSYRGKGLNQWLLKLVISKWKEKSDMDLLVQKCSCSNPYSILSMKNNLELMMFHCLTFLENNIFYIKQYDAVVIAKCDEDIILCYDIFTDSRCHMEDILGVLVEKEKQMVVLGFTPVSKDGFSIEKVQEKDYHVFVLKDSAKLFEDNKISLPLLSHA